MKLAKIIFEIVFTLIFAWIIGLYFFVKEIPTQKSILPPKTDAIIALTGGKNRLDEAFTLLKNDIGKKLLISGVNKESSLKDIAAISKNLSLHESDDLSDLIDLGYKAISTSSNALETKEWMKENNFKSMTLVTSNYHIPRSKAEFKHIMQDYEINFYPVFTEKFDVKNWWKNPQFLKLVISEYNKYIYHKIKN